jgi:zinc protease
MPALVYGPGNPYAKLGAGSGDPAAVRALTRDDLVAFHKAWIRPDKAKIFVVSNLPLAEVKAAFEKRFGSWKGEGTPGAKAFTVAPKQSAPKIVLVDRPDSPQSLILAGQMTSLVASDELLPTVTANEVLGSGFLSRINMELRENKHWSYGAGGGFQRLEHAVPYVINAPVQADKTGESIKVLMTIVGDFLTTKGVTEAELTRNVNGDIRELAGRYETSGAVLTAMQFNDLLRRPDNYYDSIAQKYRALTAAQLDAAARKALDPNRFVWVVVGDAAKVKPQLDGLGLTVEVVPAKPAAAGN